jgi:CRP-like cAMP-binding protein
MADQETMPVPMDRHEAAMGFGPLSIFIRKLLNRSLLSTLDQQALATLPHKIQPVEPGTRILHEGDRATVCPILLDGFVYRYKVAADGGRQIVALKVPGDALDFQSTYLHVADHDIRALTPAVLANVPLRAIEALADQRPAIARALLVDTILEGSISREWLLNIGRRNAEARLAHLLCELYYRIDEIAGAALEDFEVPITQEQLADLLGLTPVHINRMLKRLDAKGAIRSGRRIRIMNLSALEHISDFSDIYLHRNNFPHF